MNFFDNKNHNFSTFSPDFEQSFGTSALTLISKFLDTYTKPEPQLLGLISQKRAQKELEISHTTLLTWEKAGLKRYMPPVEGTRLIYYKITDLLVFLGVDDDN